MTQISGKKYQMRNAAGTENRFPYTVMEAVLGLNTYLQDQFSALADIYMPIEGITESKTGQEFVYRQSAATIKAKSLTLDRIYGKTLAWNQLVQNGNFVNNNNWVGSFSVSDNVASRLPSSNFSYIYQDFNAIVGHKYLFCVSIKAESNAQSDVCAIRAGVNETFGNATISWTRASIIITATSDNDGRMFLLRHGNQGTYQTLYAKDAILIDLTLLYGSEIDGMTDAEILAKFESEFPGYHSYSAGKLISNDAESLENTGFNLWDEEWEVGGINISTGEKDNSITNIIRSKNLIPVFPNSSYYYKNPAEGILPLYYDANKNYIGIGNWSDIQPLQTTPANCYFIMFIDSTAYGTTYNHDICINLSDPAKNGTYEPYRKTTLQLGLNNFKVKSHNIWDEEWELGAIDSTDGSKINSTTQIRSKNYIPVLPNTTYYRKNPYSDNGAGHYNRAAFYDANKQHIGASAGGWIDFASNAEFTTPANAAYMLFYANSVAYNHDICINVSSSFNGQYEPHGDIAITGGLKSAGSVKDEIVGNKYVKRVGSVDLGTLGWYKNGDSTVYYVPIISKKNGYYNLTCQKYRTVIGVEPNGFSTGANTISGGGSSNLVFINDPNYSTAAAFTAAMSGVYIDYELATPIEYELVEPLVYSMAAGTTEERISPNADGLSAPFCCDMTYDANANNDSANAQYAATAGRLYNTHKLWGRDFDGSNDVSGALSGVTSINSLLNFSNSNVGIGKTPSVKLDVNGAINSVGAKISGTDFSTFDITRTSGAHPVAVGFSNTSGKLGYIGLGANGEPYLWNSAGGDQSAIYHAGNSNKNTVDWMAQNLSLNGTITGAKKIVANGSNQSYIGWFQNTDVLVALSYSGGYGLSVESKASSSSIYLLKAVYGQTTLGQGGTTAFQVNADGKVGVGTTSPAYKLDVNGTLNASGNTTIGGTFTVGTSSVNKATTLYGALTASGAVSFTSTLGVTGLSTLAGGIKLTTTKKIWFGDSYYLELTSSGLHTNAGFYSDSFITAGGVGSGSGGGSNLVKERAYDISLTQIASSDYAELIRSPYITDSESGFMFAYSPAFLDTASQMHDYVIDAIGHEIGSCDIQWIGIAIGSTYTDVGVFDSGAFLVLAKSGNTYYWYEFEV